MNKLNNGNVDKLKKCSKEELKMYMYFCQVQNEWGFINNLTYKEVVTELEFQSNATFYNCLYALKDKGLIRIVDCGNMWGYYNIELVENTFRSEKDYKKGYINLNLAIFHEKAFIDATANVKIFVMELIKKMGSKNLRAVYFTEEQVKKALKLKSTRVAMNLIKYIQHWFNIVLNNGTYIISKKVEYFIAVGEAAENKSLRYRIVSFLRRFKIGYTEIDLTDLITMFKQFGRSWGNMFYAMWECKRYGAVQTRLVNKILKLSV